MSAQNLDAIVLKAFGTIPFSAKNAKTIGLIGYIQTAIGTGIAYVGYSVGQGAEYANEHFGAHLDPSGSYLAGAAAAIFGAASFLLATGTLLEYRKHKMQLQTGVQVS